MNGWMSSFLPYNTPFFQLPACLGTVRWQHGLSGRFIAPRTLSVCELFFCIQDAWKTTPGSRRWRPSLEARGSGQNPTSLYLVYETMALKDNNNRALLSSSSLMHKMFSNKNLLFPFLPSPYLLPAVANKRGGGGSMMDTRLEHQNNLNAANTNRGLFPGLHSMQQEGLAESPVSIKSGKRGERG